MTKRIGATELQRNTSEIVYGVAVKRETVVVTQNRREVAVMLHPDEYAALLVARERLKTHLATKTDD